MSSEEQVIRVYAPAIVASVTDANRAVARKFAKVNIPRVPMGWDSLSVFKCKTAVSVSD